MKKSGEKVFKILDQTSSEKKENKDKRKISTGWELKTMTKEPLCRIIERMKILTADEDCLSKTAEKLKKLIRDHFVSKNLVRDYTKTK